MIALPDIPSFKLTGKKALVVGASSGIGLASACALASKGAFVTLASRRLNNLEKISNEMSIKGWTSNYLEMDISDIENTKSLVRENGPFDILVNSAGLARHSKMVDTTLEDFDEVMNVNLKGAYFLTQSVAMGLLKVNKPGSLINISSQMAHVGGLERAVYCASKFAVEGFTKAMAIELGPSKIRVNTICPTFIKTALTENTLNDPIKKDWVLDKIKLNRFGEIEDVMGAVIYLASDVSTLVTGSSMMIDGGWTAD
jgi:NAD(P)-dependent dehydrogenase (short-subunit alcohol dehydrogenase family)